MRDFSKNHEWLSINTATVRKSRGQDLPLTDIIEACVSRGINAISPWRDQVAAAGLPAVARLVKVFTQSKGHLPSLHKAVVAEVARKRGWPILEFNSRGGGGLLGQVRTDANGFVDYVNDGALRGSYKVVVPVHLTGQP